MSSMVMLRIPYCRNNCSAASRIRSSVATISFIKRRKLLNYCQFLRRSTSKPKLGSACSSFICCKLVFYYLSRSRLGNILKKLTKKYFTHHQHTISYYTYGRGKDVIIAFHGYGQDHRAFRHLGKQLGPHYTIYAFDLFFHGNSSRIARRTPLHKDEWCAIVAHFLKIQQITIFSIMGYSLGGRFALTLVECYAERIEQLILIAPDGIKHSFWYHFSSSTILGNYLLRAWISRPKVFFRVVRLARQSNLIDKSLSKLVLSHMDTRKKRYEVYCRWTGFRLIKPDLPTVIRKCNEQEIYVRTYLGEYDRVIKAKSIIPKLKKLKISRIHCLPCGHNSLLQNVSYALAQEV